MASEKRQEKTRRCRLERKHLSARKVKNINRHLLKKHDQLLLIVCISVKYVRNRAVGGAEDAVHGINVARVVTRIAHSLRDRNRNGGKRMAVVPTRYGSVRRPFRLGCRNG